MEKEKAQIEKIYIEAIKLARDNDQLIREKNDYYITIEQLQALIMEITQ